MTTSALNQHIVEKDEIAVRKEAIAWYARMCSGDAGEADLQGLQQWLAQHPDHRKAWAKLEGIRQSMQRVPTNIAMPALRGVRRNRRAVLRSIVLLASTGSAAYISYRAIEQPSFYKPWVAEYRTRVGERRSVLLADGSRLVLNTDSAADVTFTSDKRIITLWSGEALIETASHRNAVKDARPLVIRTEQGTVRALGTRFTVRTLGDRTQVAVLDDAVELQTIDGKISVLQAGESVSFSRADISAVRTVDDTSVQWEQGSLLVGNERLGDVIAELARYRRGYLFCDDAVADIRVSGAFPIDDTDKALTVLMQSFPLRITRTTRYWVVIGPV